MRHRTRCRGLDFALHGAQHRGSQTSVALESPWGARGGGRLDKHRLLGPTWGFLTQCSLRFANRFPGDNRYCWSVSVIDGRTTDSRGE